MISFRLSKKELERGNGMYKIKYLPIARQDIIETIQYIAEKLQGRRQRII